MLRRPSLFRVFSLLHAEILLLPIAQESNKHSYAQYIYASSLIIQRVGFCFCIVAKHVVTRDDAKIVVCLWLEMRQYQRVPE